MTIIKKYVEKMDDEICGAKEYAENYVEEKAKGNNILSAKYKSMAEDEIRHANIIHDVATNKIAELSTVFQPTQEMQDMWDKSHKDYVEQTAFIRQMLTM